MNYELAKQLKDAGFPFNWVDGWNSEEHEMQFKMYPSLSELIQACGDAELLDLGRRHNVTFYWYAQTLDKKAEGKTPEEAVANLWLALHSK